MWQKVLMKIKLTSTALEVEGAAAESTPQSSSIDMAVDASVLFESLKLVDSTNCFLEGSLLLLPVANPCPLIFLQSAPNKLSCSAAMEDHNYGLDGAQE